MRELWPLGLVPDCPPCPPAGAARLGGGAVGGGVVVVGGGRWSSPALKNPSKTEVTASVQENIFFKLIRTHKRLKMKAF